jgi:DNA-binding protein WhiA
MPFTSDVKNELYHLPINENSSRAEIAGLLKFKGSIEIGKNIYLELTLKDSGAARRTKQLLKVLNVKDISVMYHDEGKLKVGRLFTIRIMTDKIENFLDEIGLDLTGKIKSDFFSDPTLSSAFFRGAFIASGSIANPAKYHHLEFYNQRSEPLEWMKKKLEETFGIVGFIVDIRYGYRLYVKNGEMINEFLNLSGATNSAKLFSSLMASKRIHSDVTRSMNFIEANSKRSGNASWKQIAAIIKVDKKIGLDSFPKEIQDAAALRLSNPELSLREIGNMLEPPVSKSIVHRRLMKILDEADKQI